MVFGVGQFNYASHIWLRQTLVAMATKISDFQQKIGYNSDCAGDTPQILAYTIGFSGSANLMMSVKLCSDDPGCHGNENWEFYQKICHSSHGIVRVVRTTSKINGKC